MKKLLKIISYFSFFVLISCSGVINQYDDELEQDDTIQFRNGFFDYEEIYLEESNDYNSDSDLYRIYEYYFYIYEDSIEFSNDENSMWTTNPYSGNGTAAKVSLNYFSEYNASFYELFEEGEVYEFSICKNSSYYDYQTYIYLRSADGCMYGTVYTFDTDDNANNEEFRLSYGHIKLTRNKDDIFDLEFEYLNSSGEIITVSEETLTLLNF